MSDGKRILKHNGRAISYLSVLWPNWAILQMQVHRIVGNLISGALRYKYAYTKRNPYQYFFDLFFFNFYIIF